MDVQAVMTEQAEALGTTGIRPFDYGADRITPPAALIFWQNVQFDQTYGRGSDRVTIDVVVCVGKADNRSAWKALAQYVAGSGDKSVKQALETFSYTNCDTMFVSQAELGTLTVSAVEYLAATFSTVATGRGEMA